MSDENRTENPMATGSNSRDQSILQLCGARTRQNGECRHVAMPNGRCRFHGGLSTGPKTPEGLERLRDARTVHGSRGRKGRELRALVQALRAEARRVCEAV